MEYQHSHHRQHHRKQTHKIIILIITIIITAKISRKYWNCTVTKRGISLWDGLMRNWSKAEKTQMSKNKAVKSKEYWAKYWNNLIFSNHILWRDLRIRISRKNKVSKTKIQICMKKPKYNCSLCKTQSWGEKIYS